MVGADRPQRVEGSVTDPGWCDADVLKPESDLVLDDREDDLVFRILEDTGDGPGQLTRLRATRIAAVHLDSADEPAAVEVRDESGEGAKQRGLPRAGSSEQADELTGLELEGDVFEGRAVGLRIRVAEPLDPR